MAAVRSSRLLVCGAQLLPLLNHITVQAASTFAIGTTATLYGIKAAI
jgi:hypothetical protein